MEAGRRSWGVVFIHANASKLQYPQVSVAGGAQAAWLLAPLEAPNKYYN